MRVSDVTWLSVAVNALKESYFKSIGPRWVGGGEYSIQTGMQLAKREVGRKIHK